MENTNNQKFNNYDELISYLNSQPTDILKLKELFRYLLNNCEYNYELLKMIKLNNDITYIFEKEENIQDEDYRKKVLDKVKKEFGFNDETMKELTKIYGEEIIAKNYSIKDGVYVCNETINHRSLNSAAVLMCVFDKPVFYQPKLDNGLLTSGICSDISEFINNVCKDVGIRSLSASGVSSNNMMHAWNKIMVDGQDLYYDLTYEMFIRDNHDDWANKAKPGSWLGVTEEQMKALQPTRTISGKSSSAGPV